MALISELMVKIGVDLAELTSGLDKASIAVSKAKDDIGSVSGAAGEMGTALEGAASKASSAGANITDAFNKTGGALTVGLTAPIVGIGVAAMKSAQDMNAAMANVATLIPGNTERINELKTAAQDLGPQFGKSSTEMANGLYELISTFGDTADTVKILEINAKSAAAGLSTVEESIAVTSAVTKAYGDTSAEAVQKVADLAFQTVNLGKTTLPELSASIGSVTPLASTLGVSMEDLFGQIAALTGVTGSTAEVTTQLRATYQAILKPTDEMAGAMVRALGAMKQNGQLTGEASKQYDEHMTRMTEAMAKYQELKNSVGATSAEIKAAKTVVKGAQDSFQDWAAGMGQTMVQSTGFAATLKALSAEAGGNTNTLAKMFGSVEALNAVLALTGSQADSVTQKTQAMREASGAVNTAFNEQANGVNASGFTMAQFSAKLEVATQKLGDGLAPALTMALNALSPLIDMVVDAAKWFASLPAPVQGAITAIVAIVAAVGPVLLIIGQIITAVTTLAPAFAAVQAAVVALTGTLAINPVVAIVIAIVAAATLIATNWDAIKAATKTALDWLTAALATVIKWTFVDDLIKLVENLPAIWDAIKSAAGAAWQWIKDLLIKAIRFTFIDDLIEFAENVPKYWQQIQQAFNVALAAIKKQVSDWIDIGKNIIEGILTGLKQVGTKIVNFLINLAKQALAAIKEFFGIESPSTEFADVGRNLMLGMAEGIRKSAKHAVGAAAAAARDVQGAASFSANLGGVMRGSSSAVHQQPAAQQPTAFGGSGDGHGRLRLTADEFAKAVGRLVDEGVSVNVAQPGSGAASTGNSWAYAMRGV